MNIRTSFFALFAMMFATAASHAQVKVISAYYGRQKPERTVEVTEFVQKRFNLGSYQFTVAPSLFGVNPNPGRQNVLIVQYSYGGQKAFAQAADGSIFTLPGFAKQARPPVGTPLRFENGYSRATIYVYELDRWGAWQWKAQLSPGEVYTARGQSGDLWVMADRNGRVLREVRVAANMAPVYLR